HLESAPALVQNVIAKSIGQRDVKVRVFSGSPADEIVRFATPRDLLVCGTHARSALGRFVFGSVAAKLLRHAPCPVLVVRPREDDEAKEELAQATSGVTPASRPTDRIDPIAVAPRTGLLLRS